MNHIGRGRDIRLRRASIDVGQEFCLMVKQPFVNFNDAWRRVFALDLVNYCFVVIRETIKYDFKLVFMVKRLAENSELIQSGDDSLDVLINGLVSFM